MPKNRTCWVWTAGVFAAALLFYLLTASFVPIPGASAEFMTALAFPGRVPVAMQYPLDAVLGGMLAALAGPERLGAALTVFAALLGALTVTGLFRATVAGVRFSCLDLTGIREGELPRVRADIFATAMLSGVGAAIVGAVALPVWALGTRLLPGALSAVLGVAVLTFAMGCRWRAATRFLEGPQPSALFPRLLMGAVFGFSTFLGTTAPSLLPVAILGIILVGGPLIDRETEDRLAYVPWIVVGVIGGVALSVLSVWLWQGMFGADTEVGALALWGQWMQSALPELTRLFLSFEGAAPLALFALGAALLLGCFPAAYLRFGVPLVGQVAAVALMVVGVFRWPAELWDGMAEPSALDTVGVVVAVLVFGLTVGSWARNWLDVHTHWALGKAHTVAAAFVAVPSLLLAGAWVIVNAADGAGRVAQCALKGLWAKTDAALSETAEVWWSPSAEATGLLLRRAATGKAICPVQGRAGVLRELPERFAARLSGDPVPAVLEKVGPEALRLYLAYAPATADAFLSGAVPDAVSETFGEVAAALEKTTYGRTPLGKRTILELRAEAARALVNRAASLPSEEAIALLRRALALNPKNPAATLGLDALGALPQEATHPSPALLLLERFPWLRKPLPSRARAFEERHGHVRTPAFDSARRLWALSRGDYGDVLAEILTLARENPASLNRQERLLALLSFPEAEAYAWLDKATPDADLLEALLCVYPWTERSEALFAKHRELLKERDALALMYQGKGRLSGRRIGDKVLAFFLRDGRFAYARFYVNGLLKEGQIDSAVAFVSGFNVAERLANFPALAERLRARTLEALTREHPADALETARAWVASDPWQPLLWSILLANPAQPEGAERDVLLCLAYLPLHPEASRRFAEKLRAESGEAVAARYLETVARARKALLDKESHAHR